MEEYVQKRLHFEERGGNGDSELYYEKFGEQLDQLFRDVTAGKFGADAKTGEWYLAIKAVKEKYPKTT